MAIQIKDGTGTGYLTKVNNLNRILTRAETTSRDQDINERQGKVWSTSFEDVSPTGADDFIYYLKNTGDNAIAVSDLRLTAATAATRVKIVYATGTPSGGTSITPISRTVGSSAVASVTCEQGSDITGISNSGLIFHMELDTVGRLYHLSTSSKIRIPKGEAIALLISTATAVVTGVISIYEEV